MTRIEETLDTRVTADWSIAGTLVLDLQVYVKDDVVYPPLIAAGTVDMFVFPATELPEVRLAYQIERQEWQMIVEVWGVTWANVDTAIKELKRIGNAYSDSEGKVYLGFLEGPIYETVAKGFVCQDKCTWVNKFVTRDT